MAEWFEQWFNTKYYHILYKNRNDEEAANFLKNIIKIIDIQDNARILDVACGKGRHAIQLNKMGYRVVGIDISPNNILTAKQIAASQNLSGIEFWVKDMRESYGLGCFDLVLNLFTSLGYFADPHDNLKVIKNCSESLNPKGHFVIDFFNSRFVLQNLVNQSFIENEGITFEINRTFEYGFITKKIKIKEGQKHLEYQERVKAIDYQEFEEMFDKAQLKVHAVYGSYQLDTFDPNKSERVIFILKLLQ